MSTTYPSGGSANLVARAKAIILTPDSEWLVIDLEPASVASLYRNYIMVLAAIPPVARFLHEVLFGYGAFGFVYHPSFIRALVGAIVQYAISLGVAYVMALIIDTLAPTFAGQKNQVQALKLVAYASTATWLAGVFAAIPGAGLLGILGLYSAYLFFRGLPVMMKSPPEKSLAYTAVIIVVAIVLFVLIAPITAAVVGSGGGLASLSGGADMSAGTLTTPGGGSLQLDRLQQAAAAFEASTKATPSGDSPAVVPTDRLKTLLPAALPGGLPRTETSSAGGQVAGFGGSSAEAVYSAGGHQITLDIADLGTLGALAGLSGVLGISGDKETPTSYSRVRQEGGRTVAEEYDTDTKHGSYAIIFANRFMIHAEGAPTTMDDLHAAVASVDADKLAATVK
jgi:hypothetical protein